MTHRPLQVGATLQRAVQTVISRGLNDPRIRGMITVTRVRVSDDLRDATIFVTVTPGEREELTLHGLRSAAVHIRRQAGELMEMRTLPRLHFKPDREAHAQAKVIAAINEAVAAIEQNPPAPRDDDNAGEQTIPGAEPPKNQSEESP